MKWSGGSHAVHGGGSFPTPGLYYNLLLKLSNYIPFLVYILNTRTKKSMNSVADISVSS